MIHELIREFVNVSTYSGSVRYTDTDNRAEIVRRCIVSTASRFSKEHELNPEDLTFYRSRVREVEKGVLVVDVELTDEHVAEWLYVGGRSSRSSSARRFNEFSIVPGAFWKVFPTIRLVVVDGQVIFQGIDLEQELMTDDQIPAAAQKHRDEKDLVVKMREARSRARQEARTVLGRRDIDGELIIFGLTVDEIVAMAESGLMPKDQAKKLLARAFEYVHNSYDYAINGEDMREDVSHHLVEAMAYLDQKYGTKTWNGDLEAWMENDAPSLMTSTGE